MILRNRRFRFLLRWAIIAGVFATVMTRAIWGYWFAPSSIAPLLNPLAHIESASLYVLDVDADGQYILSGPDSDQRWYYSEEEAYARPGVALRDRDVAYGTPDADTAGPVAGAIQAQGWWLFQDDVLKSVLDTRQGQTRCGPVGERYLCWGLPFGYVIQGTDANGVPLMFISASSMNAVDGRDDHYYYYEALFEQTAAGDLMLRDSIAFQYDSAGIEFAQWPFWFITAWVILLLGRFAYLIIRRVVWIITRPGHQQAQMA